MEINLNGSGRGIRDCLYYQLFGWRSGRLYPWLYFWKENGLKEVKCEKMTKDEVIKEIEENIQDVDKCISEDEEYIRGWKSALLVALELMTELS